MTKDELRASMIKAVTKELDAWLDEEPEINDPIEYEKKLLARSLKMGRAIMEGSQGELSQDRNKKNGFLQFLAD